MKRLIALLLSILMLQCCSKEDKPVPPVYVDISNPAYKAGFEQALKRAEVMTSIVWTPLSAVPKTNPEGEFFEVGKKYKGIPYSSVKELDKFVGQDVSFYTFLSATRNPRSVLYTEFVNQDPYHGTNCAPYYGTVCSMSINYALGIDAPFASKSYKNQSFMSKISDKDIDKIEPGDILASDGHTIMVTEVFRGDDNRVLKAQYFENSSFITMSREDLEEYWVEKGFIQYRYAQMSTVRFEEIDLPDEISPSICVNRGDRSVYRRGEDVVVNILDGSYPEMDLYRDGMSMERFSLMDKEDILLTDLDKGIYSAVLVGNNGEGPTTSFEILDVTSSAKKIKKKRIEVGFTGNYAKPTAVELCKITGGHLYTYALTDEDRIAGKVVIPQLSTGDDYYCKVLFQGEYGKIASNYIRIK